MDIPFKSEKKPFVIKNKTQMNTKSLGGNTQPFEEDRNFQRNMMARDHAGHLQTQSMVYQNEKRSENLAGSWINEQNLKNHSKPSRERPARHIKSVEDSFNPSLVKSVEEIENKNEEQGRNNPTNERFEEDARDFLERSLQSTKVK
jgi:hypothetical protein